MPAHATDTNEIIHESNQKRKKKLLPKQGSVYRWGELFTNVKKEEHLRRCLEACDGDSKSANYKNMRIRFPQIRGVHCFQQKDPLGAPHVWTTNTITELRMVVHFLPVSSATEEQRRSLEEIDHKCARADAMYAAEIEDMRRYIALDVLETSRRIHTAILKRNRTYNEETLLECDVGTKRIKAVWCANPDFI